MMAWVNPGGLSNTKRGPDHPQVASEACPGWTVLGVCRFGDRCLLRHINVAVVDDTKDKPWWFGRAVLDYFTNAEVARAIENGVHRVSGPARHRDYIDFDAQAAAREILETFNLRMQRLEGNFAMQLQSVLGSGEGREEPAPGANSLLEIWQNSSPQLKQFVFADFVDPRVRRPEFTAFDVSMRALAVIPIVRFVPTRLQKKSVLKAVFMDFLEFHTTQAREWVLSPKRVVWGKMLSVIDSWKVASNALSAAAPVITSLIGLDSFRSRSHKARERAGSDPLTAWEGFDAVFSQEDVYPAFAALRDPRLVLPSIIRAAESSVPLSGVDWTELRISVGKHHAKILRRVMPTILVLNGQRSLDDSGCTLFDSERLFALLWRCYLLSKADRKATADVARDWLAGGMQRRLDLLIACLESPGGVVQVRRSRGTENLILLFLAGMHQAPGRPRSDSENSGEGINSRLREYVDADYLMQELFESGRVVLATTPPAVLLPFLGYDSPGDQP